MPRERPFTSGQLLEISPTEWPFVGPNKEKISRVRVLEDNGTRMVVESAVEGVPIHRFSTVVIVAPKDPSQCKFAFAPVDERLD